MKTLKSFLKKFMLYLGAFVAMVSITAGFKVAVFFISYTPTDISTDETTTDDNSLIKILNNFMTTSNANLALDLKVTPQEQNQTIAITTNIVLDMADNSGVTTFSRKANVMSNQNSFSLDNLKLQAQGDIKFSNQTIAYEICYINGVAYANFGDVKFKISTDNLMEDLNKIMNFGLLEKFGINFSLPDLSGFSLDPSILTTLAKQLEEQEVENARLITLNLAEIGTIQIVTDIDYALKSINFEQLNFNGTTLKASCDADLAPSITPEIVEPENKDEITDFSGLTAFLESADKIINDGKISGKIVLNIDDVSLNADYLVNFKDMNNLQIYLSTRLFNQNILINYHNNKMYMAFGENKYYFDNQVDFNELFETIKYYANKFGVELPEIELGKLADSLDVKNLSQMLSLADGLKISADGLVFTHDGFVANINVINGEFDNITASYDRLNIQMTLQETIEKLEFDETEFKNISKETMFETLYSQLFKDKKLALDITTTIFDTQINATLMADFGESIKVQLVASAYGKNITLTIIDNDIYIDIDKILKAHTTFDDIIDLVKENKWIELPESINFDLFKSILAGSINFDKVVTNFVRDANDKVEAIDLTCGDLICQIKASTFAPIEYQIASDYEDLTKIIKLTYDFVTNYENSTHAFDVKLNWKDYVVTGTVQLIKNELSAHLTTTIFGKQINLYLQNNAIYVECDGLKFMCSFDNIKDLYEYAQTFVENMPSLEDVDIEAILNQSNLILKDDSFEIVYQDLISLLNSTLSLNFEKGNCSGEIKLGETFEITEKTNYFDVSSLKQLAKAVYNTLKNLSISGDVDVTLNLFNEDNHLNIDYAVAYENDKLFGYITTEFKGLNINAYLDGDDIYVDVVGLKVHFNINQVNEIVLWINSTFNTNLSIEDFEQLMTVDGITEKLKDIHFDVIKTIQSNDEKTIVEFNDGLKIVVDFDEYVNVVTFEQNNRKATLNCTDFEKINLDTLVKKDFKDYSYFTPIIENFYNLVMSKQYDILANVYKYHNDTLTNKYDVQATIDCTSMLNAFVDLKGLDAQITAYYQDKALYFSYGGENGLKLSIQESALQEILSIACSALNIDTSSIPFLSEFLTKTDLDTSDISTLLPTIEFGNPLQYLEYIENFEITDAYFAITLKAEKLGEYANGKDITIRAYYANKKITIIEINNFFTNTQANEYINMVVKLNDFVSTTKLTDTSKYIDISNSKDLIRAFVNTSNLHDFHIHGKVKLNIDIGISFDAATIDVDALIKTETTTYREYDETLGMYVEKQKYSVFGMIELGNYPLIAGVNNSNTNGGLSRTRTITIFFKDGYIYLSTVDAKQTFFDKLERATKITPEYLMNNLKYYMQYLLGFTDTIQSKINEAIDASSSYQGETDYSNIILSYTQENNAHVIQLNLTEIAHNQDIGTLTIVITTIKDESNNNLDYLYRLDVDLKLLDNMISITTDTSSQTKALFLVDIGKTIDSENITNYCDNYDLTLGLDGEYEKQGGKDWTQANTGTTELRLYSNGELITTLSGQIASQVSLPNLENRVIDDGKTKREYRFDGWFYDENYSQEFTSGVYPRYNTSLFAKWTELYCKNYITISFISGEENIAVQTIVGLNGDDFILPVCANIETIIDANTSSLKIFDGWYTLSGQKFTSTIIPEQDITLYGKWIEKITKTYTLQIFSAGTKVYDGKVEANQEFVFPSMSCFNENTKYYSSSDFKDSTLLTSFVVNKDSIWYARNMFNVNVVSEFTTSTGSAFNSKQSLYENSSVILTQYPDFSVDKGSYTIEYVFKGYMLNNTTLITDYSILTPSYDAEYKAVWEVKEYCFVTFNAVWIKPDIWVNKWSKEKSAVTTVSNTNDTNKIKVEKGTTIDFSNYVSTCKYAYIGVSYNFKTVAWSEKGDNVNVGSYSGSTTMVVLSNQTLNPIWKCV